MEHTNSDILINKNQNDITQNMLSDSEEINTIAFKDLQNNISFSSDKDLDINKTIIICPDCKSTVEINIKDKTLIHVSCNKEGKDKNVKDFLEKYIYNQEITMTSGEEITGLYCKNESHKTFHIFSRHCNNCNIDLCYECELIKTCGNHNYKTLHLEKEKEEYLNEYLKNKSKTVDEDEINFCELIKGLKNTNKEFPNIKSLNCLDNIYKFLNSQNQDNKIQKSIFIKERKDLSKKYLEKNKMKLNEINFDEKNFYNLTFLAKVLKNTQNVDYLVKLVLSGNNLTSIKKLVKAKTNSGLFINLKHLDLSRNHLQDKDIKYIAKFDSKNLKELFLHMNDFTDYTLLNVIHEKFNSELKILFFGFNKFEKNVDKLKMLNFPKLVELGANYLFDEKTFENLAKFKLENLEELFIQNNGITKLDFLEKMNLKKVKLIFINNNELDELDFKYFKQFPTLERISVGNSLSKIINVRSVEKIKYFDIDGTKVNSDVIKKNESTFIKGVEIIY